jgi:hypothetical protein
VFLEGLKKMIQLGIANVLNGKVIHNECKHDGALLVMPETGGGGCLVVVKSDACLGETVHATVYFKVDPGVTGKLVELVLINEILGDVSKINADILWLVEGGVETEFFDVHDGKLSITLGENTVDEQLYKLNQARGGTYISRICNVVAANGDARTVSVVSLLRSDLANNIGVGDFPVALGWDLVRQDEEEGIGAFDLLTIIGTGANDLA